MKNEVFPHPVLKKKKKKDLFDFSVPVINFLFFMLKLFWIKIFFPVIFIVILCNIWRVD